MSEWIRVSDELPPADKPVLAAFRNECGRTRVVCAFYAPAYTIESDGEWDEFADYHEERDTFYTPEGWYENNEYDETNWKVAADVTHWMPLPAHPDSVTP